MGEILCFCFGKHGEKKAGFCLSFGVNGVLVCHVTC